MSIVILSKILVSGHSMIPTYCPGDKILTSTLPYLFSKPKIGDVIVFKKDNTLLIKRISKITNIGLLVEGDNKDDSYDSASFGIISKKQILGKVVYKL